jgi:two-component system CheB/CheR fusion protein
VKSESVSGSKASVTDPSLDDEMDTGFLQRGAGMLPIVGLGGSAGGIAALQEFFAAMPVDSGMAFVVILHLSPTHESTLAEIFQRSTTMPVLLATDGATVKPNSVYVIPPGKFLASANGHLRLSDAEEHLGKRVAVDYFFRTLAETHGIQSLAVVLSGAGGDGALGLKRVKELGGLTVAQDPDEAEHPDMPRAAIATGVVDWVLGVKEMPAKLLAYVKQRGELKLPREERPLPAEAAKLSPDEQEAALRDVLAFLHTRTGRDFSCYKRATMIRRIARRMQVNGLVDLPGYLVYLRTHTGEAAALLQDLLISVTNFFRDSASFAALERIIPELFKDKDAGDTVRVWVAGCATGEEAYSIAMLLCEHAATLVGPPQLQIFATDLDEEVIREAREGLYPETIAADVSEVRLRHFFIHEQRGYRVRRAVRELVLFAPHDLLKDSPFSRLELISCRNLLIYLNREAQSRAFDIFHFALRPGGRLFLGTSEAVDEGSPLFAVLDKKQRLYVQRPGPQRLITVPTGPGILARVLALQERTRERPTVPGRVTVENVQTVLDQPVPFDCGLPPGELHYRLIERFSPPSILVNSAHEIVHLSESAGRFLQFTGGEPTRNLLRTVHPMLRVELRAALYAAAQTYTVVTAFRIPVETGDARSLVDIRVTPAGDLAPDFLLVVFEEHPAEGVVAVAATRSADADQAALHLERELVATKAHLRDTIEESEASTEELKASNEELQAMNEELRSATEELETSREELQSINEELTTVNDELKSNVDQLARSNNDLQNFMAATDIATVFLDRELRIQRFTPSAKTLFNFISTDLGRPLSDLSRLLDYPEIVSDAEQSLAHLQPAQREVRAGERWYIARTLPYRTADDHIAGVVLSFLDITEQKHAEEEIARLAADSERQRRLYETILTNTPDFVYVFSLDHRVLYANESLIKMWGRGHDGAIGKTFLEIGYEPWHAAMHDREIDQVRATRLPIRGEVPFNGTSGRREYDYIFVPIIGVDGEVEAVAGTTRDVTDRKAGEERLRASEDRQTFLVKLSDTLRPLSDPIAVQAEVSRVLGERLGANRVAYFEVRGDDYVVAGDYTDAVPSIAGRYPVASFGPDQLAAFRAGRTAFEIDVNSLESRTRGEKEAFGALQVRSYIAVPLVKNNNFVAGLAVHSASVRTWTPSEVAIIEETAERTWAAVERVRAETALRQSEERAVFVRRSSGVGFWYCDLPFDVLEWDELVKAHFHLPPDAAVTIQTFYDRIHPDDRELTRRAIEQSIAGRTPYAVDYRTVDPGSGAIRWVRAIGRTFYAPDGTPTRFDGVTLDVSDQKRAEASLRESEQRFRVMADAAPVLIWMSGTDKLHDWFNQPWLAFTGRSMDQEVGNGWAAGLHPDDFDRSLQTYRAAFDVRTPFSMEYRLRRHDGEFRWMSSTGTSVRALT